MTLADRTAATAIRKAWQLAASLPPERASALGSAILHRTGPWIRKHRMVQDNLRTAFPDRHATEIEAIARASWAGLGRMIAEFPHVERLLARGDAPLVELVDETGQLARAASGQPMIAAGGHFANWELLAGALVRAGVPLTVVHAARANPRIEALVARHRRALGCQFLEQGQSVLAMRRHVRAGRSIGVLVDQRYDDGAPVPFFGRPAMTALAPALLAVRFDLPFVPVRAERLAGCRFRITVEPALRPDPAKGPPRAIAHDLTTRLHDRFEAWIRERPEQWLCIKRRWPKAVVSVTTGATTGAPAGDRDDAIEVGERDHPPARRAAAATPEDARMAQREAG